MPQIQFQKKANNTKLNKASLNQSDEKHLALFQSNGSKASTVQQIPSTKHIASSQSRTMLEQQNRQRLNSSQANNNRFKDFKIYKDQPLDNRMNTTQDLAFVDGALYRRMDYYDHLQNILVDNQMKQSQGFHNSLEFTENQKMLDDTINKLVLYNPSRMQKDEQDKRINLLLKKGKNQLKDIKLNKTTCHQGLNQSLDHYRNSLKSFYKQPKISQITEDKFRDGSNKFNIPYSKKPQSENKNRTQSTQPGKRVKMNEDNGDDGEDEEYFQNDVLTGIPNETLDKIDKNDIIILKKKFEDSEANIIHELYTQHFGHKQKQVENFSEIKSYQNDQQILQLDDREQEVISNKSAFKESVLSQNKSALKDSVLSNKNYPNKSQVPSQINNNNNNSVMHNDYEYEKVKYVQYIPKNHNGSIEDAINSIYLKQSPSASKLKYPDQTINQSQRHLHNMQEHEKRCQSTHSHARQCVKNKEFDAADLQNQAFKYLVVQRPYIERTQQPNESQVKASFYPISSMPDELQKVLHDNQEFQKTMMMSEKVLMNRPRTSQNAQSRFFNTQQRDSVTNSIKFQNNVMNMYQQQLISQEFEKTEFGQQQQKQQILNQKRNDLMHKFNRNQEETYDSNKLDPDFFNQQISQADFNFQQQHPNQQYPRNYYFPKVSILNYFSGASQDSQLLHQNQNHVQSLDFSLTPISQYNLKLNIEKECAKYHHNNIEAAKNLKFSSKSNSLSDEGLANQQNYQEHSDANLTQNIFKPRNINGFGSSVLTSPGNQIHYDFQGQGVGSENVEQGTNQKFFNFKEVNKLQKRKWKSPFMHQKECDLNKKVHLQSNEYQNFEKSFKVNHALSLNTSINNPNILWRKNKDYGNYQTRKRESLAQNVVEHKQGGRASQQSNIGARNSMKMQTDSPNQSLITAKLKCHRRPLTQQHARLKNQRQKCVDTQLQCEEQQQQNQDYVANNNNIRFDTDSMSMSSGNINVTVNQQSIKNLLKSKKNERGGKRLIISKRSGESFGGKNQRSKSRQLGTGTLPIEGSGTLNYTSGILNPSNKNND